MARVWRHFLQGWPSKKLIPCIWSILKKNEVKYPSSICIHFYYYRQPEGCLQYHTTLTGRFQTFNFADSSSPAHLANQKYVRLIFLPTYKATQFCLTTAWLRILISLKQVFLRGRSFWLRSKIYANLLLFISFNRKKTLCSPLKYLRNIFVKKFVDSEFVKTFDEQICNQISMLILYHKQHLQKDKIYVQIDLLLSI